MAQHILRRVALQNAVPNSVATAHLYTQPGEACRQIMVCGLEPDSVEAVMLICQALPIVDVRGSRDWETDEWITGGQHLARLNRWAGLHLCGGHFSILLDDFGSAAQFPSGYGCTLNLHLNKKAPRDARFDIALLCGIDL